MKDIIKSVNQKTFTTIDTETGEILDIHIDKTDILYNTDNFLLMYDNFLDTLIDNIDNLTKTDIELLFFLIKKYSDGISFTINIDIKKQLAKRKNRNIRSYDKCTKVLLKHNFIMKVEKRVYRLNPKYFYRGSSKLRNKEIIELSKKKKK